MAPSTFRGQWASSSLSTKKISRISGQFSSPQTTTSDLWKISISSVMGIQMGEILVGFYAIELGRVATEWREMAHHFFCILFLGVWCLVHEPDYLTLWFLFLFLFLIKEPDSPNMKHVGSVHMLIFWIWLMVGWGWKSVSLTLLKEESQVLTLH